jgi:hypothetical protein
MTPCCFTTSYQRFGEEQSTGALQLTMQFDRYQSFVQYISEENSDPMPRVVQDKKVFFD